MIVEPPSLPLITKSLSDGVLQFSNYFEKIKPNYLFVFADKFEILNLLFTKMYK